MIIAKLGVMADTDQQRQHNGNPTLTGTVDGIETKKRDGRARKNFADTTEGKRRQLKSSARAAVAMMSLFLPDDKCVGTGDVEFILRFLHSLTPDLKKAIADHSPEFWQELDTIMRREACEEWEKAIGVDTRKCL